MESHICPHRTRAYMGHAVFFFVRGDLKSKSICGPLAQASPLGYAIHPRATRRTDGAVSVDSKREIVDSRALRKSAMRLYWNPLLGGSMRRLAFCTFFAAVLSVAPFVQAQTFTATTISGIVEPTLPPIQASDGNLYVFAGNAMYKVTLSGTASVFYTFESPLAPQNFFQA